MRLPALIALFVLATACDQHKDKKTEKSDKAEPTQPEFKGAHGAGKNDDGEEDGPTPKLNKKNLVADMGFRVDKDGFNFPNFRLDDADNLKLGPKDLKKMCGEKAVCAGGSDEDECTLKSGAQAFLTTSANLLGGGHCEGFSVGSLRLFMKEDAPSKLGGDSTYDLDRQAKVERYLAYWAVSQMSPTVAHATFRSTPNKMLDRMIKAIKAKDDLYVLGIHRADGKGGHAIAPYAVEDKGDDIYWVYVYENNSPSKLRHVEFDKSKNTWRYDDAATSPDDTPSVYSGTATSPRMELIPQSARNDMACPFAAGSSNDDADDEEDEAPKPKKKKKPVDDDDDDKPSKVAASDDDDNDGDDDVMLVGRGAANLSVEDDKGHTLGVKNGEFVSEIPGATYVVPRGKISSEMSPILFVPAKVKMKLSVRGKEGEKADVAVIGKKFAATLTGVSATSKPADAIEIDGKKKVVALPPVAVTKIELFMDKGKTVQKLEVPLAIKPAAGGMLKLDGKKGKLEVADVKGGAFKPIAAPLTPVIKPIATPKLDGPVLKPKGIDKPGPMGSTEPGKPADLGKPPIIKPIDPVKPAETAKPADPVKTPPIIKPIAPMKPADPAPAGSSKPPTLMKPKIGSK